MRAELGQNQSETFSKTNRELSERLSALPDLKPAAMATITSCPPQAEQLIRAHLETRLYIYFRGQWCRYIYLDAMVPMLPLRELDLFPFSSALWTAMSHFSRKQYNCRRRRHMGNLWTSSGSGSIASTLCCFWVRAAFHHLSSSGSDESDRKL